MQNEKFQMYLADGTQKVELIIREVNEVNELPIKEPVKINIRGTIGAVREFLTHRFDQPDQINQKRCHILVERDTITIVLIINENDEYNSGKVMGALLFNPKFLEFGINTGKVWTPTKLGLFFKMNRAFFTAKDDNMKLVAELMNFTATVNNIIERSAKENGDRSDKFAQVVNSNLPKSFSLNLPIFKGRSPEIIEVETFVQIDGRDVAFTLISPGANVLQEELRNAVIDDELKAIRVICPDIAIIEK